MCINVVADSVVLYVEHDFYNTIFKIEQIICSIRVSPPQWNILGAHLLFIIIIINKLILPRVSNNVDIFSAL